MAIPSDWHLFSRDPVQCVHSSKICLQKHATDILVGYTAWWLFWQFWGHGMYFCWKHLYCGSLHKVLMFSSKREGRVSMWCLLTKQVWSNKSNDNKENPNQSCLSMSSSESPQMQVYSQTIMTQSQAKFCFPPSICSQWHPHSHSASISSSLPQPSVSPSLISLLLLLPPGTVAAAERGFFFPSCVQVSIHCLMYVRVRFGSSICDDTHTSLQYLTLPQGAKN